MSRCEPGEQPGAEVGGDAEREHVDAHLVDQPGELLDLLGRVELRLVADEVVDPVPAHAPVDHLAPEVGAVVHLVRAASAAPGARTARRWPARSSRVKMTPAAAAGRVVVVHLQRERGLAAVHGPGEEGELGHAAAYRLCRVRNGTSISCGVNEPCTPTRSRDAALWVRESTIVLRPVAAPRGPRSRAATWSATGPNHPAATASSRVATTAARPERRRATAPRPPRRRSASDERVCTCSARGSPATSSTPSASAGRRGDVPPARPVDVDHAVVGGHQQQRARREQPGEPGELAVELVERVAPLPGADAVVVADLVDVAPVQVDERRAHRAPRPRRRPGRPGSPRAGRTRPRSDGLGQPGAGEARRSHRRDRHARGVDRPRRRWARAATRAPGRRRSRRRGSRGRRCRGAARSSRPCPVRPGPTPVPSRPSDAAVVDGKPVTSRRACGSSERRNGAWPARSVRLWKPSPSTRTRHTRSTRGRPRSARARPSGRRRRAVRRARRRRRQDRAEARPS